ncbi:hypothetical protein CERZMDRAFT_31629 [Cercospora zeae-maydis SCOH1-5]|uniref:C2H2-type domain-containing protein n=1 Tax=Cercospora zeae-maydis SCOH1-5 TaxID=717836 RepID=A0A6A6FWT4_9PEZI|nr:hypothetical protein CERZMDRAFT_31629 [Cercospora zeae-maydis SCOH1-5]
MDDAEHEVDDVSEKRSKKKRRVVKTTTDKKYECPQPDCGKAYSRAEHLYRHQLNHTPKNIYRCDFPGCDRQFVRADLCARHKERHTAKGSHLQRKDAFMHSQRQQSTAATKSGPANDVASTIHTESSPSDSAHSAQLPPLHDSKPYLSPATQPTHNPYTTAGDQQHYASSSQHNQQLSSLHAGALNGVDGTYGAYPPTFDNNGPSSQAVPSPSPSTVRRYSVDSQFSRPTTMTNGQVQPLAMHPPPLPHQSQTPAYTQSLYQAQEPRGQPYQASTATGSLPPLPPFEMQPPAYNSRSASMTTSAMTAEYPFNPSSDASGGMLPEMDAFNPYTSTFVMPVFNVEGYDRSSQQAFDFARLMNDPAMSYTDEPSPPFALHYSMQASGVAHAKPETDNAMPTSSLQTDAVSAKSPEVYAMDLSMRESNITAQRQQRMIAMVEQWGDIERVPGQQMKSNFFSGDFEDPVHPLSVEMLKTYLTSFWIHIHQQMPIMHRPSFNAQTCPDLLLLAMMCLGASCMDRTHTLERIKASSELAFFCASHIRWEIFKDPEFRPPAKMWTFQTMIFLELYEKMYSTRALHERAHIHHATTIAIMRRGSSLIGRGATDEAKAREDPTRTPPGPDGSINTSGQNTADPWWNTWISKEASLRVGYAAFVIDSTHAAMFGHTAAMTSHDLAMDLPCDEQIWAAPSGIAVKAAEGSLSANGFRRVTFREGLQRMMNKEKVITNVFGRVILMAGLLNLSWQMNSRDLQASSLSAQNTIGNPDKWCQALCHAVDHWRKDYEAALQPKPNDKDEQTVGPLVDETNNKSTCHREHGDNVSETLTCLHSLAHMSLHVELADLEILAGADLVLGRAVIEADRVRVRRRLHEWARSPRARMAVYWAMRILRDVLMPEARASNSSGRVQPKTGIAYSARDDYLLNRPYILYYACMVVWAYGYILDGQIANPQYSLVTVEAQVWDMQQFLGCLEKIVEPSGVENMTDRNRVVGLLIVMRGCLETPRWELLQESARRLESCMELLRPGINQELRDYLRQQEQQQQQQQQREEEEEEYEHYEQH